MVEIRVAFGANIGEGGRRVGGGGRGGGYKAGREAKMLVVEEERWSSGASKSLCVHVARL